MVLNCDIRQRHVFHLTLIPIIGLIIAFNEKAAGQADFSSGAPGGPRNKRRNHFNSGTTKKLN
jgi:hypothetical protein